MTINWKALAKENGFTDSEGRGEPKAMIEELCYNQGKSLREIARTIRTKEEPFLSGKSVGNYMHKEEMSLRSQGGPNNKGKVLRGSKIGRVLANREKIKNMESHEVMREFNLPYWYFYSIVRDHKLEYRRQK